MSQTDDSSNNKRQLATAPDTSLCAACGEIECTLQGKNEKAIRVSSKWISCDTCDQWYHGLCQNLQQAEVTTITKLAEKGVRWHCNECLKDMKKDPQYSKARMINQQLAVKLDNIEKLVTTLTTTTNQKMGEFEKTWADVVKKQTENINQNKQVAQQTKVILQKTQQQKEEENRKNNAIVTGITETGDKTALEQIKELMKLDCFSGRNMPVQAIRLGSKADNASEQKRPIKVRFENETSKWEFLKRFANDTLKSRHIYCKLDESEEVRRQQYILRKEVRELKQSNEGKEYRVRNMQIQHKSETGEWKNLKTAKQRETIF